MKSYLAELYNEVWAVQEHRLREVLEQLSELTPVDRISAATSFEAAMRPGPRPSGAVAVLPVQGFISKRETFMTMLFGGASTELLGEQVRQFAADPAIKAIVLDIDSPGGTVGGVQALADDIFEARGKKPVIAVVNSLAASAAYWIASAASDIVVTLDGEVGSIGVFTLHVDQSRMLDAMGVTPTIIKAGKYKTEGNPFEPLSAEAEAAIQARVDDSYSAFVNAVARGRGVKAADVRSGYGEGRVVGAKEAIKLGMADRMGSLRDTLARLGVSNVAGGSNAEDETAPTFADSENMRVRLRLRELA